METSDAARQGRARPALAGAGGSVPTPIRDQIDKKVMQFACISVMHRAYSAHPELTAEQRRAFMAGRDRAVEMLRHAVRERRYEGDGGVAMTADLREGLPHNNFVASYIRAVVADPALLEGFSAVLSDFLGSDVECMSPDLYAGLTFNEIHGDPAVPKEME